MMTEKFKILINEQEIDELMETFFVQLIEI
ncbi:hypothetical protein IGI79_001542 [Enterococcus sp. AZ084]|uniref:Transposase n=1 Tax=Candidatus Enterococcus mangumiae TaxID=2230878 RepID=A0ABZ2SZP7_9ENTE